MKEIVWQAMQSVPYDREIHIQDDGGRIFTCEYDTDYECWAIYDGNENHPMFRLRPVAWAEL